MKMEGNFKDVDKCLFERFDYTPFYPRIGVSEGRRIITRSGVVLPDLDWTMRSVYSNPIVRFRVGAVTLGSLLTRPLEKIRSDRQYAIIHSVWSAGYYHWLTESLPRALLVRNAFPDATILLPPAEHDKFAGTLLAVGVMHVSRFPEGSNVLVDCPVVTDCPRIFATTHPRLLNAVRNELRRFFGAFDPYSTRGRFVYVTRRGSRGRRVSNESSVIELLVRYGFEVHDFDDTSFADQVRLMSECEIFVSIHGAALTNMLFMNPGGTVLELLPIRKPLVDYSFTRNSFRHDACYLRLATAFNLDYRFLLCGHNAGPLRKTHMADLDVDLNALERQVTEALLSRGS